MPNRVIKESICRSDSIDSLSWFEEVMFYRLIVSCDDYGRFDGRAAIIKGSCFPLKDVTVKQIEQSLNKLASVGLVRVYEAQGRPYLQISTWEKHQQIRAKRSKFPSPDEACNPLISNDINGNHEKSDDNNCPRNPIRIQSESESKSKRECVRACVREPVQLFDDFWSAYPLQKKLLKTRGEYAYVLETTAGLTEEMLVSAAKNYAEECRTRRKDGEFIMHPDNWLRESVWMDYLPGKYHKPEKKNAGKVRDNNNFQHRQYDFEDLESHLLGK